jgi:hypothetical protein
MSSREVLPDHLVRLPDESYGRWALWRTICVRAAGFPAEGVLRIADAECAAAADRLSAVEAEAERLREAALEALRGELAGAGKDRLDGIIKAIRRVKRSQPPATAGLAEATSAAIDSWREAAGRAEAEKSRYQEAYAAAEERLEGALREAARDPRFREAVVWQNRHAAATGLASFLRRPSGKGRGSARERGHAQMLVSYLQRYCTKNDTVGFFGPVGWAQVVEGEERIAVRPGDDLIACREVYFEGWAMDVIADRLAADEAMRPWLSPLLSPFVRVEGTSLVLPNGQTIELGPLGSALVAGCDGTRPARAMIRELAPPPDKEPILWGMLANLQTNGLLRWTFQIPLSPTPERSLRDLLLAIEEEPLRERAVALLDGVIGGREAVVRAAGDPEALERALGDLDAAFTRATERAATRGDGELYAGRTLVYEDCRRDLDLELGTPLLAELAPALTLVLASARWFSHYMAVTSRELFLETYEELKEQGGGSPVVDGLAFTRISLPRVVNIRTRANLLAQLRERWERVLAIPEGERRVHFRSEDLRPLVQREFAAPGPGWQRARHHSPDLLIAAESVEAIRRGDYLAVMGEVHANMNTLDRWLFFTMHPRPEELRAAMESDLPEPSLVPALPKTWNLEQASAGLGLPLPSVTGRMDLAMRSPKDFYLEFCFDPSGQPASQQIPIGDLVVERDGNRLLIGPRDGRIRFDVVDFYQLAMMIQTLDVFRVAPRTGSHAPRITIDRLVIARETWSFPAPTLAFAQAATAPERFAAARRWAAEHGLPRFVFTKTPPELKPFYVDFESPALVENFAKAIRKSAASEEERTVLVSEMLPAHDQLWLPDAQGNRYSCELRTVALDLEPVDGGA